MINKVMFWFLLVSLQGQAPDKGASVGWEQLSGGYKYLHL
jgi:hypothetical protein